MGVHDDAPPAPPRVQQPFAHGYGTGLKPDVWPDEASTAAAAHNAAAPASSSTDTAVVVSSSSDSSSSSDEEAVRKKSRYGSARETAEVLSNPFCFKP